MANEIKSICVFCGSSPGASPAYAAASAALGRTLGRRGLRLVYGGGNRGLMGVLATEAKRGGAEVIGVIPERLHELVEHPELSRLVVTKDMHERKAVMAELSDAFIALPGGTGTLEELFEALTWRQIGYHAKPVGLLDVAFFWEPLMSFLRHAADEGFIHPAHLEELAVGEDPDALIVALEAMPPPSTLKLPERRRD